MSCYDHDAREVCYVMIDLVANGLKSILSTTEDGYHCDKFKSRHRSVRQFQSAGDTDNEDCDHPHSNVKCGSSRRLDRKNAHGKLSKRHERHRRHSHHRHRVAVIDPTMPEFCASVISLARFYPEFEELREHLKSYATKNCRPQKVNLIDQTYKEKDILLLHGPQRPNYTEQETLTDKPKSTEIKTHLQNVSEYFEYRHKDEHTPENDVSTIEECTVQKQPHYRADPKPYKRQEKNRDNENSNRARDPVSIEPCTMPRGRKVKPQGFQVPKRVSARRFLNEVLRSNEIESTDAEVEVDDMNRDVEGKKTTKHVFDWRLERESPGSSGNSGNIILIEDDYVETPINTYRAKPVLLRAAKWIFGGCPDATICTDAGGRILENRMFEEGADRWHL
ncbi:hypothetical protein KM043_016819 [Ampulex compressa]|nr:hypothetical protein KM043_016819 [Ampulex compressa]